MVGNRLRQSVARSGHSTPVPLFLALLALSGCFSTPAPTSLAEHSDQADRSGSPATQSNASASPGRGDTEAAVIEEVLRDGQLQIPIDARLVGLTRDDFLSGSRREDGREIVGGGLVPKTQFWFVLEAGGQVATAAWVEQRRSGSPSGAYRLPADPLHDLIEIVLPELNPDQARELTIALEIEDGVLPESGTDVIASAHGVRFHLIADQAAVFLVATSST